jgi:putative transposase
MAKTAIKLLIDVDNRSSEIIDGQSRTCNWLYNNLLEKANNFKTQFKETKDPKIGKIVYGKFGLRNLIPEMKQEHPFLKLIYSAPLKNTALRLTDAIKRHKNSKKNGWPKFRSWKGQWFSLFYDEPNKGFFVEGDKLTISLGRAQNKEERSLTFTLKEHTCLKDKILRNLRITKEFDSYYAIFTVEKKLPIPKPVQNIIALDPNHKNLAYGVDITNQGIEIQSPYWLKSFDKRMDELKSLRDRCEKKSKTKPILDNFGKPIGKDYTIPSKRWLRYDRALKKTYQKRRDQTKTFLFTTANRLYKIYDVVAIGDYTPKGNGSTPDMRRSMNNRSLIGRFKKTLSWVAQKSGKIFMEFEEKNTTRTCNKCLFVELEGIHPSQRMWQCPCCKLVHIRDENAAQNGLRKVLRNFTTKNEDKPSLVSCSDLTVQQRWAWSVKPRGMKISRGNYSNFAALGNLNEGVVTLDQKMNFGY